VGRGAEEEAHIPPGNVRINIVARKRPIGRKEVSRQEYDVVTCLNPTVVVHYPKTKVDGITKYLENQTFEFDHVSGARVSPGNGRCSTDMVYEYSVLPLVAHIFTPGGRATCFAYGQTGSGKTYTMSGVQLNAARDIFRLMRSPEHADKDLSIYTAFFEIYGGRCFDVLHGRSKVVIREDGRGNVQAVGLRHVPCASEEELLAIIEEGNASRTTKKTHMNDASSRSHAVCEILVKDGRGRVFGKMSLIDLAGSERAADARHHDRQRRVESAGINKSLLALKECIRALGSSASHVPFRASKLTLALKDNFTARGSRTVMIAAVSPAASSADHTQNTLRYAERVKQKPAGRAAPRGGRAGLAHPVASDLAFLQASASEEGAGEIGGSGGASARGRMGDRRGAGAGGAGDSGRDARGLRTSPVTVDADDEDEDGMGGGRAFDAEYDGDGPSLAHVYGREEEEEAAAAALCRHRRISLQRSGCCRLKWLCTANLAVPPSDWRSMRLSTLNRLWEGTSHALPPIPKGIEEAYEALLLDCFAVARQDRPSAQEVLQELLAIKVQQRLTTDAIGFTADLRHQITSNFRWPQAAVTNIAATAWVNLVDPFGLKRPRYIELVANASAAELGRIAAAAQGSGYEGALFQEVAVFLRCPSHCRVLLGSVWPIDYEAEAVFVSLSMKLSDWFNLYKKPRDPEGPFNASWRAGPGIIPSHSFVMNDTM
ncbi:DSK1, partial [Symbiodinium sp. KB8]